MQVIDYLDLGRLEVENVDVEGLLLWKGEKVGDGLPL